MSHRYKKLSVALLCILGGTMAAGTAVSQTTYTDNFMGANANLKWLALDDACLTAGSDAGDSSLSNPIIPSCKSKGITVGTDETVPGQGALLLTPATDMQTGAILSAFPPFPMTQGISVTFTTYTYGGDSGGTAKNGADGIVFFLTDGTKDAPKVAGGEGGSMGYGCSNGNDDAGGMAYGYLGLGIDEFGNFLNSGDNGSVGIYNSQNDDHGTTAHGDNSYQNDVNGSIRAGAGPQYQPERIGLRGSGNTNWDWLSDSKRPGYSSFYSGGITYNNGVRYDRWHYIATTGNKVQEACRTGTYVTSFETKNSYGITYQVPTSTAPIKYNYNAIPGGYAILPDTQNIANNSKSATRNPTASTTDDDKAWPITYRLNISPTGLLNFAYSYNNGTFQQVLANYDITKDNGPLPASLRFGFSAGTGGSNNVHEITCFKASPLQANSSAGSNTISGKVTGHTQFFLAAYSTNNWWGSLVADPLLTLPDGTLAVGSDANWDAKCTLTGGTCDTVLDDDGNPKTDITAQDPSTRTLFTSSAEGADNGVSLSWSNLSADEQAALNTDPAGTTDTNGQARLNWLRGVRTDEQLQDPAGDLRARQYVLGDIINSSPTFVGAPTPLAYPDAFKDNLYASATIPENANGATAYSTFVSDNATRTNVVYVGSNDGFLHGFRAGNFDTDGSFDATTNDGQEVVGYMPRNVLLNKAAELTDPEYSHEYMVDATPVAGDVFYNDDWHTWLVGGVGSHGEEIFALDVTDPSNVSASDVIGDWDQSTLTHLGNTAGTPIIARLHNGDWAFIFGSGLVDSTDQSGQKEGVYIGLIDASTGDVSFKFLDTGDAPTGVNGAPGGIAYVSSVDLDGDHIADYLYAGDTQGRVWRFDVTSNNTSDWSSWSTAGTNNPLVVFTAKDADGNVQPITTAIALLAVQTALKTRIMLYFGTGQQIQPTTGHGVQYATGTQTVYGIWDWHMDTWNSLSASTNQYASLSGTHSITRSTLLSQDVKKTLAGAGGAIKGYRTLSNDNVICWQGDVATGTCPNPNQFGWEFDLPDAGATTGQFAGQREQIIYNAAFIDGAIVVNTAIPPVISATQCNAGLQSGWTMAFNPETGGGFDESYFPKPSGAPDTGTSTVGGISLSGVGTPTAIQNGGKTYIVTQTVTGGAQLTRTNPPSAQQPARVSWRELVSP